MKAIRKAKAGFTLLEIMITMALVMLGLLVVLSSMVAMSKSSRYSQRMDVANTLAQHELEHIRNIPFSQIVTENGSFGEYSTHPDYRHQTVVTTNGNVKTVTVDVFFDGGRRRAELTTYVANL